MVYELLKRRQMRGRQTDIRDKRRVNFSDAGVAPAHGRHKHHSATHDADVRAESQSRRGSGKELRPERAAGKRLGGHPVFDQTDDCSQDRASNSAACKLADKRANVDGASGLSERRNYCRQDLSANAAADRAGNCIAGCSQAQIF